MELNPRHPFVVTLLESLPEDEDAEVSAEVKDSAWILLDMAIMSGGFPIRDPKKYSARMTRVLKGSLGVESLDLAEEIEPPEEEEEPEEPEFDMPDGFDMDGIQMVSADDMESVIDLEDM